MLLATGSSGGGLASNSNLSRYKSATANSMMDTKAKDHSKDGMLYSDYVMSAILGPCIVSMSCWLATTIDRVPYELPSLKPILGVRGRGMTIQYDEHPAVNVVDLVGKASAQSVCVSTYQPHLGAMEPHRPE